MKYSSELFLNDGNGVSEDGKHFIIHRLNPKRGLPNQPEYIDEEIPIEDGEGWAAEYRKEQKAWATREEAYHDKQINVNGVPTEDGENPMEVVLDLIADNKFSPEVLFEYVDKAEEEKKRIEEEQRRIEEEKRKAEEAKRIVYDGMNIQELTDKLNRSLHSNLSGKGEIFARLSIEYNVDPYLAVAISMHETGCKWNCSRLVKSCNNVGGMKGSPGCGGGAYASFPTLDEGIRAFISNISRNYASKGLTTPESMGPKYAGSQTWATQVRAYMNEIKAK